jgi:ubiquinone/menaquinone biosynthesis C-methylase UbiE
MLGSFPRETAADPEPFTGERMTASVSGQIQVEHYHRYLYARSLCEGLDVLDVASGEGYGSAQLAQVARSVIGVEYAAETVSRARANFPRSNLRFVRADARALPLADSCVDAVVSFETIEHFDRQDAFLDEVRRVLRPNGRFIVSTPDRDVYSPAGAPPNPYHVREYDRREFDAALRRLFPHVAFLVQRAMAGSALLAESSSVTPTLVFERRGDRFEACGTLPRAPYVIAVASDREPPSLASSLYIERGDLDTDAHGLALRTAELASCREELARQAEALAALRRQCEASAAIAARASEVAAATEQERGRLEERCATLARELVATRGSLRTFLRFYWPNFRRHFLGR